MAKATVKVFVVSDANPSEYCFDYDKPVSLVSALQMFASELKNAESYDDERNEYAPEYDTRTVRIEVTIVR